MENFLQSPLPETISDLQDQIAFLDELQSQCEATVRELMEKEDRANKISFPKEIHELRQQKNMLQTHKDFRLARLKRLQSELV